MLKHFMTGKYNTITLILIIAIAIFFRFWQFDLIPPGLYQDEAMNGANALESLNSEKYKVFYTDNNGREGMIVWLDAIAIKIFGNEPWVLRLFPTLAGVLAVLGLYFLSKELLGAKIALASSFFMAVSFWAVNFSRMGFRANLMLPFLIWSFYFLWRGINPTSDVQNTRHRMLDFIVGGILFGLGFYTYISYRFAPLLVTTFFILYFVKHRAKNFWLEFVVFASLTFIIALPIGLYFLNNPDDFFGRSEQVSIFSADSPFKAAIISIITTLGMFNIIGDLNWRHNFSGSPQLFWPVGLLFILGVFISLKNFKRRDKFLFSWLFIFLLPNILTVEGNPHALRALGAMPVAMIFSGIGLVWIYEKFKKFIDNKIKNADLSAHRKQLERIRKEFLLLLTVFLFFVAALEFNKYFLRWPQNQKTIEAFSKSQVEISNYLNDLPDDVLKYVIWHQDDKPTSNGLPVSAQTIYFLGYGKSKINYVKANEFDKINLGANYTIIVPLYFDLDLIHTLNKKFPNGKIEFIYLNTPVLKVP